MSDSLPIPVTVVIPVKNEEKNLPQCLSLLSDFSEIIVVDSNSTDSTPEIVKNSGYDLINFVWNGHFPKKRNWVLRNVVLKNEWVLFLDADEWITEAFKSELRSVLIDTDCEGFWISYQNHFLGKNLRYGVKMKKLALIKKGKGEYEFIDEEAWSQLDMEIHEHPVIQGKTGVIKSPLIHLDFKGLSHYIVKHNEYSTWEANRYLKLFNTGNKKLTFRQKIKYRLLNTWSFGFIYLILNYVFYLGFLDGRAGYVFSVYKMQYFFNVKAKIVERTILSVPIEMAESEGINLESEGINLKNEGIKPESEGINLENEGIKPESEGINSLFELIVRLPGERANFYSENLIVPLKTIERWLKKLRNENKIEFRGSKKNGGYWSIITNN